MHRYYGIRVRFLSYGSRSSTCNKWDPTVSLELNHPSLILLEKTNSRNQFKQILGQLMRCNLTGQTFPMSRLILFSAISYPENLDMATTLFTHFTPCPNIFIYNTMISALSLLPLPKTRSFDVYKSMLMSGVYPDKNTLLYLLKAVNFVSQVMQIHCHAIVTGLVSLGYLQNSLVKMYTENGLARLARQVFEQMSNRDVVSFNIMIVGYAKRGNGSEALRLFHEMVNSGIEPDEFTMLGLLVSCGQSGEVKIGKAIQGWMERRMFINSSNLILDNALLDMYVKCQKLELALRAFSRLEEKDVVSWNTIVAGCAKFGELELGRTIFDQMPSRDLVSWNSLISGYASRGNFTMAMELFKEMVEENVSPDNATLASIVFAATEIGASDRGRWAHGWAVRMEIEIDAFLGSALIDMYCKCGSCERAFVVFNGVTRKDVTAWTAMISGFAFHGYGTKALKLFSEMQRKVNPNGVTFLSVLTACSHSGLVEQGLQIFNSMIDYGIEPGLKHYGCLVDLLARSGRLAEAMVVIERMPMKPSRSIWGAMLNACRAQGDVGMAEVASAELLKLEPEEEGGYMLLSNVYAAGGQWSCSDRIRGVMDKRGVKKIAGFSSLVVNCVGKTIMKRSEMKY